MAEEWGDLLPELEGPILRGELGGCVRRVTEALRAVPETPFHIAAALEFTNDPAEAATSLDRFLESESRRFAVGAVYTEINGFSINPDCWYFSWFAYERYGGLEDPDWIAHWDSGEHPDVTLTGMEELQAVYAAHMQTEESPEVSRAGEFADLLVVLRFQQLMQRSLPLCSDLAVPVLATAHDMDLFYEYRPRGAARP